MRLQVIVAEFFYVDYRAEYMLSLEELSSMRIGIIGFGQEGQSVARFLAKQNLAATVFDAKTEEELGVEKVREYANQGFVFQVGRAPDNFSQVDVLFRSPGFPRLSEALVRAEQQGVIITSQTKWFFDYCPCPIVGVTGTKGKGTTVTLIARILQQFRDKQPEASRNILDKIYVTGNIGKLDPLAILPELNSQDVVVFELSSFQLQDLHRSPHVGVCLMVTQEHLNHHKTVEEYREAKSTILAYQHKSDIAVYSDDYIASQKIGAQGRGKKYMFSRDHAVTNGVYAEGERVFLKEMQVTGSIDVSKRLLRGAHNLENICAAVAVCATFGVPIQVMEDAVVTFPGLEHRLEFVGEYGNVKFYNDSMATVPESSIVALQSFLEPKVLILGGSSKGSDFTLLGKAVASANIRGVILIGDEAASIDKAITTAGSGSLVLRGATTMEDVFRQIKQITKAGDVVLLSPGCASFGMFKSYKDRGEQFKMLAKLFA